MLQELLEKHEGNTFIILEGFDDALLGVYEEKMVLIYSTKKCIEILMKDMPISMAVDYFYLNIYNAYIDDKQPIFCDDNLMY
jgi:hypothetical protein